MQSRTLSTVIFAFAFAVSGASGCDRRAGPRDTSPPSPLVSAAASPLHADPAPKAAETPEDSNASAGTKTKEEAAIPLRDLVTELSEPDASFFSDNYISNETSYLQVGGDLEKRALALGLRADELDSTARRPGGVYLGVGPEQNFTYIALTRPKLAFIVDIRRQNMILHLLYKALFDEATSRSHFLTLLFGRPYDKATDPGAGADIGQVLAHTERLAPDAATFSSVHERARGRIEHTYGITLDAKDKKSLESSHRAFLKDQLGLRFSLRAPNGRAYPTLRELLAMKSPDGRQLGFMARESDFRFVQAMQREHRIIPVVGDFAGDRAMPGIAAYLRQEGLPVSTFYVSNVEQYLFEGKVWDKWVRNIAALPVDEQSVFLRAYLDQGRPHPKQMKGHRTATVLQRIAHFNVRQKERPYGTFWAVATDGLGSDAETGVRPAF